MECEKWLRDHSHEMTKIFSDGLLPHKPFDVFAHGDCWVNNILFKYNEDDIPVDIRFVDFQNSKKASPVLDLNYFLYSSINGDLRLAERDTMIGIYYDAFQEVFEKSGKPVPN
ncbi:hypothetical protein Avbf_16429 [Armadillidium vulgare]|nr:hypothetical protein Avbf_16429 [Armadillidium vulgare]